MSDHVGISFVGMQNLNDSMNKTHAGTTGVQEDFTTSINQLRAAWDDGNGESAAILGQLLTELQEKTNIFLAMIRGGVGEVHDHHLTGYTRAQQELESLGGGR